jgi:hypothetical protein
MPWAVSLEIALAALMVILTLLIPSGRLRDMFVRLSLLVLTVWHGPTTRVRRTLTTTRGLATREGVCVNRICGGNGWEILEHALLLGR